MYKIFKFDSRNTGYYYAQDLTLKQARQRMGHFKHQRIENQDNDNFEEYQNGKLIAQSI